MSDRAQTHQNLIYAQDVDKNVQSNHIECLVPNFPLQNCSHKDVNSYKIDDNSLLVESLNGTNSYLKIKSQYIGYQGDAKNPSCILLKNNNLHIEILVNKEGNIGSVG